MEIRDLEYFVAVARNESFTRAAREMFISQSSLSEAVRRLERSLGVELFERTQHGVRLTGRGKFFVQRAEAILGLIDASMRDVQEPHDDEPETVRLGIAPVAAGKAVLEVISHYTDGVGGLTVTLEEEPSFVIVENLESSRNDVGVVVQRGEITLPHWPLFETRVMVVLSANHPLAQHEVINAADLKGLPLVMMARNSFLTASVLDQMTAADVTPRIIHRTSQLSYVEHLVHRGAVSFLPSSAKSLFPSLAFRAFEPATYQKLAVVTRPHFTMTRRVKELIGVIADAVSE